MEANLSRRRPHQQTRTSRDGRRSASTRACRLPNADDLNPQAREMADESMVRTLAAQADAIWPQERALFERYDLPTKADVLDAGCGTGEITCRLAEIFPESRFLGVDIIDSHLNSARTRCARFGDRARFENRSIFNLELPDRHFD